MAELDQEIYQPRTGDIYIQEARADHFNVHRYDEEGYGWEQLHSSISEQEAREIVASPYALVGTSKGKGKRRYYRFEWIPPGTQANHCIAHLQRNKSSLPLSGQNAACMQEQAVV